MSINPSRIQQLTALQDDAPEWRNWQTHRIQNPASTSAFPEQSEPTVAQAVKSRRDKPVIWWITGYSGCCPHCCSTLRELIWWPIYECGTCGRRYAVDMRRNRRDLKNY